MTKAIPSTDGGLKDRTIFTILIEFTETHMIFWAGWWINNYIDRYPIHDRVSCAIIQTLKDAGVELPSRGGKLAVDMNSNQSGLEDLNQPT